MVIGRRLAPIALTLVLLCWAPQLGMAHWAGVSVSRGWDHTALTGVTADDLNVGVSGMDIVHASFGFLLLVPSYNNPTDAILGARLLSSSDGRSWHPVPLDPAVFHVGDGSGTLLAADPYVLLTGYHQATPESIGEQVLWITKDGETWRRVEGVPPIAAVAHGGPGLVAVSFVSFGHNSDNSPLWASADGTVWQPVPDASHVFTGAVLRAITRRGSTLIVVGQRNPGQSAVWSSTDGLTWRQAWSDQSGTCALMDEVQSGPHGFVASGGGCISGPPTERSGVWASSDGVRWTRVRATYPFMDASASPYLSPYLIGPTKSGFVAFAQVDGETTIWSSRNGLKWARKGGDEVFGGTARMKALTTTDDGLIAGGSFAPYPRPSCRPNGSYTSAQTFVPAVFQWRPAAGQRKPVPAPSPLDPKTLRLRIADVPPAYGASATGGYIDLCSLVPSLGLHRAYRFEFSGPYRVELSGPYPFDWVRGLSIVTRNARTAQRVFHTHAYLVDPLITAPYGTTETVIGHYERHTPERIGAETRVFRVDLQDEECGDLYRARRATPGRETRDRQRHRFGGDSDCRTQATNAYAVVWREGRVIGEVLEGGGDKKAAFRYARKQWAHLHAPAQSRERARRSLRHISIHPDDRRGQFQGQGRLNRSVAGLDYTPLAI